MYLSKHKQKLKQNDTLYMEEKAQGIQFNPSFFLFFNEGIGTRLRWESLNF